MAIHMQKEKKGCDIISLIQGTLQNEIHKLVFPDKISRRLKIRFIEISNILRSFAKFSSNLGLR